MNTSKSILSLSLASAISASAAITIPGANDTDRALDITADTVIDLSLAATGTWDQDNTPNAGNGVYDPTKWAVVFKYTSVNVAAGAKVTFKNHASRAPVVWLVSGNVTIDGTVSLDGESGFDLPRPGLAEPGPGGFRGGSYWIGSSATEGSGFGFGGSVRGVDTAASYGSVGGGGPEAYGNPSLVPLIGGSGGGGGNGGDLRPGGGAGGGAILIACSNSTTLNGSITANGGAGKVAYNSMWDGNHFSGPGSGGGIRIISDGFQGSGQLSATGGLDTRVLSGNGRIRLERALNSNAILPAPAPSVVDLAAGATAVLWPPIGAPEVKIVSLGGVNAPADPKSGLGTIGADVVLPTASTTACVIETKNVEQASQVKVRITPRDTFNFTEVDATYGSTVSTSPLVIRWNATLPTNLGYSAVQVRVIRP